MFRTLRYIGQPETACWVSSFAMSRQEFFEVGNYDNYGRLQCHVVGTCEDECDGTALIVPTQGRRLVSQVMSNARE